MGVRVEGDVRGATGADAGTSGDARDDAGCSAVRPTVSDGFHRTLLETMSEGVSLSDADGVIVYTNPAEDEMFGYLPGEILGQHVSVQNAYPPEENAWIVNEVIDELRRSGSWRGEWLNRRKDGTTFVTTSRITAVELDGRSHWLCVQEDVTADRAALAALRDSQTRLQLAAPPRPCHRR